MSKTQGNLQAAFAGESQANRRYLAFAKKAEMDGMPGLARLFRVAAEGETVHALNHLQAAGGIQSTTVNLKAALAGETHEVEKMYPEFLADAEAENEATAKISLGGAAKVESVHQGLFSHALGAVETGKDIALEKYFVCGVCGNPVIGEAPEKCPICGAGKDKFSEIQ